MELSVVPKCAYIIICLALFLYQMITIFSDYFAYPVVSTVCEQQSQSIPLPELHICDHAFYFTNITTFLQRHPTCNSSLSPEANMRFSQQCFNNVSNHWTDADRKHFLEKLLPFHK